MQFSKIFMVILLILTVLFVSPVTCFNQSEAESQIRLAEEEVLNCYRAIYEAEKVGANVSELLNRLNDAGWLLSQAKNAYNYGNHNLAFSLANQSITKLGGFVDQANDLRLNAERARFFDFIINFVGSAVGAVAIVTGGYGVWFFLKRRKKAVDAQILKIVENGLVYWTVVGVLALLVASPFLSKVLVYPRTEFFTEFWILDADHRAENYPFNISINQNYKVYLGISNRLGYCAYYMVQVKLLNWSQIQLMPTRFGPIENRLPSSLPSLFNFTTFVADEQVHEVPITLSFNYTWDQPPSKVELSSLRFNDLWLNMSDYMISWNAEKHEFRGFLFFELWLYNGSAGCFQYHGRFVGLWFNMTIQQIL